MDIREILRQVRAGESDWQIHKNVGVNRRTIKKYREWAQHEGLLSGALPPIEALEKRLQESFPETPPPHQQSTLEAYRELVEQLHGQGVSGKVIWQRVQAQGYVGSIGAVYRFLKQLKQPAPGSDAVVRVERAPGEEAQVDFGYVGYMLDEEGRRRKAWCFVMTLSWSRHSYVEFVFDQRIETWLELHRRAFEFFGGVPRKIVTDNLKAAIVRACWQGTDPQVQWAYRECAEHYGFLIGPCRPATPQHKGKVERGVGYVKDNCLAGRGELRLSEANPLARDWCLSTAGLRIHGTTKQQPLVQFTQTEQSVLLPLPAQPYEQATWKEAKVARDCYVTFENAYYSVPFRLVGQTVRVRGSQREVKVFTTEFEVVATHSRAGQAGTRSTHHDHLPPYKLPGLLWNADFALEMASRIGPATRLTVERLLDDRVVDPLPKVRRLLQLVDNCGEQRLEAACQRALAHDDPAYMTVKRILAQRLDESTMPSLPLPTVAATTFARTPDELVEHVYAGGTSWR
jgi:transposase